MTPAEEIEKLSAQVKRQRDGHKKTNKELKEEKARYSVLASEYSLVLEELKSLKNSRPLAHIGRQKLEIDSLKKEMDSLIEQIDNLKDARAIDLEDRNYAEADWAHKNKLLQDRIDKLTDKLGQQFEQNRSIKKTILKTHIPENLHGFLEELSGDSSYE